ncbi:MAG: hypothetical protein BroJett030_18010 [Alphaproteobacteria bacterium]|nr:MAG: hypothetical protein BroJett030_18010 [Alphaproteobacteria bacterium]
MFDAALVAAIAEIAELHDIEPAALAAVAEVESGGRLVAIVNGKAEPLIRFEGHVFYRQLPRLKRNRAVVVGLAHPLAGRVANPPSQTARWKLVERAGLIDRPAALAATSWGVGQVMGLHWRWLGLASIDALVAEARSSPAGQVRLMARYIDRAGLRRLIVEQDWAGFARAYNGPGYRAQRYDEKIAAAYRRHGGEPRRPGRHDPALLAFGTGGPAVEELQRNLRMLGFPLIADGDFGRATETALKAFQGDAGLVADGVFGPRTAEAMARRLPPAPVAA